MTEMASVETSSLANGTAYLQELARDVSEGLARNPKQLPSKYLYDAVGSQLFEAICELPSYKITRGERALLEREAEEIALYMRDPATLIELGGGNGEKISIILSAFEQASRLACVHLVDISAKALALSKVALGNHALSAMVSHEASYEAGLRDALSQRTHGGSVMILFLGSNIGNLAPEGAERFLEMIRRAVRKQDMLLLGTDLVKPGADLLLAYDDPAGVTAAFNKNLLARLNRELAADFKLENFEHHVEWNAESACVDSYLVSGVEQTVCMPGAGIRVQFQARERILTESSYKYEPDEIVKKGARAGFSDLAQWVESQSRFALTLLEAD